MNVVALFQEVKRIYGICPCCGEVFRFSEATLSEARPPKTPFDRIEAQRERFNQEVGDYDESELEVRRAAAREGRGEAQRRLRKLAGCFTRVMIDPHDVKVLFDPVRYVAFDGLREARPKRIVFIDEASAERDGCQASIVKTIAAGNIEWITLRIGDDGRVRTVTR